MRKRSQHQMRCGHGLGPHTGCKHFMSAHEYHPGGDVHAGPQECRVPGCTCARFVDPRTSARGMTVAEAKAELHNYGISLRKVDGEYQVRKLGTKGDVGVYFTNDLEDAVATGKHMAKENG